MIFPDGFRKPGEKLSYDRTNFIAMTARVGSTALVSGLGSAGLSRDPVREILNPRSSMPELLKESGATSLVEYLNYNAARNGTGALTFKTNWMDFSAVLDRFPQLLDEALPSLKVLYVSREDLVGQAYSLWKANEYNVWHRDHTTGYQSPVVGEVPLDAIKRNIWALETEVRKWEMFFSRTGIRPLHVTFEEIVNDFVGTISRTYEFFEENPLAVTPQSYLIRSSDDKDAAILADIRARLDAERACLPER